MPRLPPSVQRNRDSPSAAVDLLSLLDIDDREDEADEISSFTLLNTPSTVRSLGPALSTRCATAAAAARGDFTLPLSATPVHTGGDSVSRSRGVGGAGGVGGRISPSPKQGSPAVGLSPVSPRVTSKRAEAKQLYVFINEAKIKTLCFVKIGTSDRFCLAAKVLPYSHCGIIAHGKGSNGNKKFTSTAQTYYVPGGAVSGATRPQK